MGTVNVLKHYPFPPNMEIVMSPLIKWTGSKRPIAQKIIDYFPNEINVYHEPFLGGGSVFFRLLTSKQVKVKHFELSDINESLISIFKTVNVNPIELINNYRDHWLKLQKDSDYFYRQREVYNRTKDPFIFYFLTRTCYNGTIRYNGKGEFNTSHHFGRDGMHPDKVEVVIQGYHTLMKDNSISFTHQSFDQVKPESAKDVVFLDPPYTQSKSLYHGNISFSKLQDWISQLNCSWYMTLNTKSEVDNELSLNLDYDGKDLLTSGNSSFSRMKGKQVTVGEYFYYKTIGHTLVKQDSFKNALFKL